MVYINRDRSISVNFMVLCSLFLEIVIKYHHYWGWRPKKKYHNYGKLRVTLERCSHFLRCSHSCRQIGKCRGEEKSQVDIWCLLSTTSLYETVWSYEICIQQLQSKSPSPHPSPRPSPQNYVNLCRVFCHTIWQICIWVLEPRVQVLSVESKSWSHEGPSASPRGQLESDLCPSHDSCGLTIETVWSQPSTTTLIFPAVFFHLPNFGIVQKVSLRIL